jgi:glutamyl/glutaminyl-tRNA synthetase
MADLEKIFDLKNVNPGAAQYDFEKMKWFNAHWMRKVEIEKLQQYFAEFSGERIDLKYLELAREKAGNLVELKDELQYLNVDPGFDENLFIHEKMGLSIEDGKKTCEIIYNLLVDLDESDFNRVKIREISVAKIFELGWKNGPFMWPFRVVLSNRKGSAGPFEIAEVIGKEETLKRLKRSFS